MSKKSAIIILVILLTAFYVVGNTMREIPNTISVFPYFIGMISFPMVLLPALYIQNRNGTIGSFNEGFWYAEFIVRYASIIFAAFTIAYSYTVFSNLAIIPVAAIMAFLTSWAIGAAFSALSSKLVLNLRTA